MTIDVGLKTGPVHTMKHAILSFATALGAMPIGASSDAVAMPGSALLTLLDFPQQTIPGEAHTMYGAAIDGLQQLPASQLKRKAADLIVGIWSKR